MQGKRLLLLALIFVVAPGMWAAGKEYPVRGMVLKVETSNRSFVVSHEKIPGLMDSMAMPFEVRDSKELEGLVPGAMVSFTLVVEEHTAYATRITVNSYESVERDPLTARLLALMRRVSGAAPTPVRAREKVPDFTLLDQAGSRVAFSSFAGKVVAINFIYTRCALPQFCLRVTNNFGVLQKRFAAQLGKDLVLLTITFDPERDTPDVMAKYTSTWKPHKAWHFLSGNVPEAPCLWPLRRRLLR